MCASLFLLGFILYRSLWASCIWGGGEDNVWGMNYRLLPEHPKVAQGSRMQLCDLGSRCPAEFIRINDARLFTMKMWM